MQDKESPVFAGIQKLTLLDFPDKTACTLFTQGCNFACPYCHNPSLIDFPAPAHSEENNTGTLAHSYVFDFLSGRKGLLDGVCISGGEPLAHRGIVDFAHKVKDLGFLVKVDTNGSYPGRLKELIETAGADYIALDIKNTPEKYAQTAGMPAYDWTPVKDSINYLLNSNVKSEFRTTVVREFHTAEDIISIAKSINGAGKYRLQCFERPENALQKGLSSYSSAQMLEMAEKVKQVLPCTELRGAG